MIGTVVGDEAVKGSGGQTLILIKSIRRLCNVTLMATNLSLTTLRI